ncbi:hypothetical protein ACUXK4_003383 [Methylorubrum extorquens]
MSRPAPNVSQTQSCTLKHSLGPGGADILAEHFPVTVAVHDHRHRDDAAGLARLDVSRVDLEVRPPALDRPIKEGVDPLVDIIPQLRI